jgi:hypothetical protein
VTEDIETSTTQPPANASPGAADSISLQARAAALADDRPEVAVGAAFAGGLLVALILKRLVR